MMLRDLVAEGAGGPIPFFRTLLRPVAMIGAFYLLGRAAIGFTPSGIPLLVFVVTGYLTWIAFLRAFSGVSIRSSTRLLMIPFYILWKLPIYLAALFRPERRWVRTERD